MVVRASGCSMTGWLTTYQYLGRGAALSLPLCIIISLSCAQNMLRGLTEIKTPGKRNLRKSTYHIHISREEGPVGVYRMNEAIRAARCNKVYSNRIQNCYYKYVRHTIHASSACSLRVCRWPRCQHCYSMRPLTSNA